MICTYPDILGVVLAGGQSSRMGQNKALMVYQGETWIQRMMNVLAELGTGKQMISGTLAGYEGVPDSMPHAGPGKAMIDIIRRFPEYQGYLFLPVDMPYLETSILSHLLSVPSGAYFRSSPLPAYISQRTDIQKIESDRVKDILNATGAIPLEMPTGQESKLTNVNTPEAWEKVRRHEC